MEPDHDDDDRKILEQAGVEVPRESRRCTRHPAMVVKVEPRAELRRRTRKMSSNSDGVVVAAVVEVADEDNRVGGESSFSSSFLAKT